MALEVGSPGSINEFAAQHPEFSRKELLAEWGEALVAHRGALAKAMGFEDDIDRLHHISSNRENQPVESVA